jgi:hypothetical protein
MIADATSDLECLKCKQPLLQRSGEYAGKCSFAKLKTEPLGRSEYSFKYWVEFSCSKCPSKFFKYKIISWILAPDKFEGLVGTLVRGEESLIEATNTKDQEDPFVLHKKKHMTLLKGGLHKDLDIDVANLILTEESHESNG